MRIVSVSVGPLASASANNIALSQSVTGAGQFVLTGSLASSLTSGTATISGTTLTTTGSGWAPQQALSGAGVQPNTVIIGYSSVSAGTYVISPSQTVSSTTVYANAVATLDKPRRVLITSAGNDSGITFTINGTTFAGAPVSETITGGNAAAVYTVTDFASVTSVTTSGSTASTVTIGTNGVASSSWVCFDNWVTSNIAIQATVAGTVNYTIQQSLNDPNDPTYPVAIPSVTWVNSNDTAVVSATATQQSNYIFTPTFSRVVLNSGTGSVTVKYGQTGVVTL